MTELREPSTDYFHDFTVDPEARVCLRGSSHTLVDVVEVSTGNRIALHNTILSFGGQRLAISDDTEHFIAGSWGNPAGGGVACYETATGRCIWHNRALNRSQHLEYEATSDQWFVSLQSRGTFLVDRLSGAVASRLRGSSRQLLGHDQDGNCLISTRKHVEFIDPRSGVRHRTLRPPAFFEWIDGKSPFGYDNRISTASTRSPVYQNIPCDDLNVLFSTSHEDRLLLATVGGSLRCLLMDSGTLAWEVQPPIGHHFMTLGVNPSLDTVYCHCWNYAVGGPVSLWNIQLSSGQRRSIIDWPADFPMTGAFCRSGNLFVGGSGTYETASSLFCRFK